MKKRQIMILAAVLLLPLSVRSQVAVGYGGNSSSSANIESPSARQLTSYLLEYPHTESAPGVTPPPEGYIPFHLEHYGRHGSRWLLGREDYSEPVRLLEKAEKAGKLTPLGEETLQALRKIEEQSHGRLGDLSDKGARQLQMIGRRMARNYPEIFTPEADLTARATIVTRCIMSMANALEGIALEAPGVTFDKDASQADMWFMNFDDKPAWEVKVKAMKEYLDPYKERLMQEGNDYLGRLVADPQFAYDSVAPGLLPRLYWVLGNTQSHSNQPWLFEEVFSRRDMETHWKNENAQCFIHGGNTPMTSGRMPFVQRNLLRQIIEHTDSAINNEKPSATLRFGHDGILVTIINLMELGGFGEEIASFEELEKSNWRDYELVPMAGNVQLVFFRPENNLNPGDVLVKAMIHEKEVTMPGTPVSGPFYRWDELRDYYINKLEQSGLD